MKNDFDDLAAIYRRTDTKPDKLYSILPTIFGLAGDVQHKTVLDLGCGSGFFSRRFAEAGASVIGIDNSAGQIELAQRDSSRSIEYRVADVFVDVLPRADLINAPFVLNYAEDIVSLECLLRRIFGALNDGGKFIAVIDLPSGEDLHKYGAKKTLSSSNDGGSIEIVLYDGNDPVCKLSSVYYSESTITQLLKAVGFTDIVWHKPIISSQGLEKLGQVFWTGYVDNPELGYVTAQKA